ncbi:MAG: tRNA (adenosine(37)-N6)-dimethylallyltransferase MiaA [Eubacteriales bacterium]
MKALAIVGPTASGKTALSLALGTCYDCEIICCDSMQVYRGMDIGTAKPTAAEQAVLPHHLLDIKDPDEAYSAADYGRDALQVAAEVAGRGRLPLFCGGTGLYIEAVRTLRHEHAPPADPLIRAQLQRTAESQAGRDTLYRILSSVDPESAAAIHPNNIRRVIRALEIYQTTGLPKSHWDRQSAGANPAMELLVLGLRFQDRELLYRRIDSRVEQMLAQGLLEETNALLDKGLLSPAYTAGQAIGYKELARYLRGEMSFADAVQSLKTATRHYAKRQMTWFSAQPDIVWIDCDQEGTLRPPAALEQEAQTAIDPFLQNA